MGYLLEIPSATKVSTISLKKELGPSFDNIRMNTISKNGKLYLKIDGDLKLSQDSIDKIQEAVKQNKRTRIAKVHGSWKKDVSAILQRFNHSSATPNELVLREAFLKLLSRLP